jgi:predicted nicotinamide N-methyase
MTQTQRTISIQLPQNAAPGDTLSFFVGENELELTVPEGSAPGDVLEIQVGEETAEAAHHEHEKEETMTRVPLDSEKTLVLHHHCPPAKDQIFKNDDDDADGTHAMAWPAGVELAKFVFMHEQDAFQISKILELGSGLGVVGLALAAGASFKSTIPKTIVLTDCVSAMTLLQYNVQQNQDLIPPNVTVETRALNWQNHDNDHHNIGGDNNNKYDLIVGSDLLYNASMIPHLVSTLKKLVSSSSAHVCMAVRWRKPEIERHFFQETSQFIEWNLAAAAGNLKCPLSWKEYGDPTCEASNQYFMQSMISIKGTLKPLAEIKEEDTTSMTQHEYQTWEQAQIQIYEGAVRREKTNSPDRG